MGLLQLCESTAGDSEASLRLQLALKAATHRAVNRAAPLLIREQQRQMPSLQQLYTESLKAGRSSVTQLKLSATAQKEETYCFRGPGPGAPQNLRRKACIQL